jgi:exodeoxyribonuclease V alpha subunit
LDDCLARLSHSHRFSAERGIGRLAEEVRKGKADWQTLLTLADTHEEIECLSWDGQHLPKAAIEDFLPDLDPSRYDSVDIALHALTKARCLCALRQGPAGVEGLNALIAERLGRGNERHIHGRPILVTRNASALGVYNGDMGILWQEEERLRACFPTEGDGVHRLPLGELPAHETAYALTVHKSQGSEYDRVLLVLPPEPHPLVTVELIYTALTRARSLVRIVATPETWDQGITHRIQRASGLADRLLEQTG